MKYLVLISILFLCQPAYSQSDKTTYYKLGVNSSGMFNRTDKGSSYLLNNGLRFNINKKYIDLNSGNSWVYGKQQSSLSNNDYASSVDFNFLRKRIGLYYWGLGNYDKSFSLKITDRLQAGVGVGYTFFSTDQFRLVLSNGILYEYSDLYELSPYETIRNSFRLRLKVVIKRVIVLESTDFIQHSLSSEKDYILKSSNTLAVNLNGSFSVAATAVYNKINITSNENLLCTFGLRFERSF